jgi:exosortase/archaeosortase family protein
MARRSGTSEKAQSQLGSRDVLWFVGGFALLVGVFYAVSETEAFKQTVQAASLELNARVASALLRLIGEDAVAAGRTISSARFSVRIWAGCDALEPFGLYAAAVLASPVPVLLRLGGLLGGAAILFVINQVRIVSIFLVGVHSPAAFETVHLDVWQTAFVFVVVILWLLWARWTTRVATSGA